MKRQEKLNTYGWNQVNISVYKVKEWKTRVPVDVYFNSVRSFNIVKRPFDTKANVSGLVSGDKLLESRSEKKDYND